MNEVNNYDLAIFADRLNKIKPAFLLLNVYIQKVDCTNRLKVSKSDLAQNLGFSRRTITNWILILARNNVIKYKYSGETFLNPYFSFRGTVQEYLDAKIEWEKFASDIKLA